MKRAFNYLGAGNFQGFCAGRGALVSVFVFDVLKALDKGGLVWTAFRAQVSACVSLLSV